MSRIKVSDDEIGGFRVTISPLSTMALLQQLLIWLVFWAVFGAVLIYGMMFGERRADGAGNHAYPLVVVTIWLFMGLYVLYYVAWGLLGREVVVLSDGALVVRRELGPVQRSRSYGLAEVRNLRYAPLAYDPHAKFGVPAGTIAFDHDDETGRFGPGLPETDALRLIATIQQKHKFPEDKVEPLPISR